MSDYQRWEPLDDRTMRQSPDGGWVLIGDYSCLKREAYILSNECKNLQSENARLKAEVERLHKYVETMERESMSDEYDINHQTRIINGLLTDKERLQAEVERLRKAGDAMVPLLGRGDYHDARINWNAAKEGKPSV